MLLSAPPGAFAVGRDSFLGAEPPDPHAPGDRWSARAAREPDRLGAGWGFPHAVGSPRGPDATRRSAIGFAAARDSFLGPSPQTLTLPVAVGGPLSRVCLAVHSPRVSRVKRPGEPKGKPWVLLDFWPYGAAYLFIVNLVRSGRVLDPALPQPRNAGPCHSRETFMTDADQQQGPSGADGAPGPPGEQHPDGSGAATSWPSQPDQPDGSGPAGTVEAGTVEAGTVEAGTAEAGTGAPYADGPTPPFGTPFVSAYGGQPTAPYGPGPGGAPQPGQAAGFPGPYPGGPGAGGARPEGGFAAPYPGGPYGPPTGGGPAGPYPGGPGAGDAGPGGGF